MRINEIVNYDDPDDDDIFNVLEIVEKECSNFISSMDAAQKFLYRGIDTMVNNSPLFTSESPTNRKSIGQNSYEQKILDTILKMSGFTALRSNSTMCSPSYTHANQFGTIYMIFPHNNCSFTWSSKIPDIGSSNQLMKSITPWIKAPLLSFIKTKKFPPSMEEVQEFIEEFDFRNTDFDEALLSGNEIAIHGTYTAISRYFVDQVSKYFQIEEGS